MDDFDVLAFGGGTAGLVVAAGAAGLGARAGLIEMDRLGGESLWSGCIPSKALLASARAVREARRASRLGIDVGPVTVDFPRVMARVRDAQVRLQPNASPERYRSLGVEVIAGAARFLDADRVVVDSRHISARHVVIATGSRPAVPSIPGLASVPYLTNETVFNLEHLPASIIVLGGGPNGLELGQALGLLGCTVTVVEAAAHILPGEDEELAALLHASLEGDGIRILTGSPPIRVDPAPRAVTVQIGGQRVEAERLLVVSGRAPCVDGLELETAGVDVGPDGIRVDRQLRTTAAGIWAAGDVVGPLRFTHVAEYQARLVLRNALFPFSARAEYGTVPRVMYTEPEIARVGLTEAEARLRYGEEVRVWRSHFADADRAVTDDRTEGLVKLVADGRGRLLGAHLLGYGAGSLIGELVLAMRRGIRLGHIAETIHPYPTYPEAVRNAAELQRESRREGLLVRALRRLRRD